MRITIEHDTVYSYDDAVRHTAQYLRLTPQNNLSQSIQSWTVDAPGKTARWRDGFGNRCLTLVLDAPVERIAVRAHGQVDTRDTNGVLPQAEFDPPTAVFLRQTEFTRPDDAIRRFAEKFRSDIEKDRLKGLHALMKGLRDKVDYRENTTDVGSTAQEVFGSGMGVCQDHAHLFLAASRYLGVPGRYVSGYLFDGGNEDRDSEPYTAGHAWASAWIDGLGWVSFDVANTISGTEFHVGLAIGLDYADTAPIRGVRTGGTGPESMTVSVRVGANQ